MARRPNEDKLHCRAPLRTIQRFTKIAERYGYTRSSLLRLLAEAVIDGSIQIPQLLEKRSHVRD